MRAGALTLVLLLAACPGEGVGTGGPQAPSPVIPDGGYGGGSTWDVSPIYGGGVDLLAHPPDDPPPKDPSAADGSARPPEADATTRPPPQPDVGIQPPQGEGFGCSNQQPCAGGMVCISGQCRVKCTKAGICGVHAACPSSYGCVQTIFGYSVCVPATSQPGGSCNTGTTCPVGYICGTTGGGYTCLPTCTKSPCGTSGAGQCISTGGNCSICSTI